MNIVDDHCLGINACIFGNIHRFIVCESDGGTAHKLMCQICLQIINYKDVKRLQKQKPVEGEIIDI